MDCITLALDCESAGHIIITASKTTLEGWMINGPTIRLLTVAEGFIDETNYVAILRTVQKDKTMHVARVASENKLVAICKRVDDITIKVLELKMVELPVSADVSSSTVLASRKVGLSLESHLAAAQTQLANQGAELASLRQRCSQLADKYAAAVDESAGARDRLLGAFCRVLNAKKTLIGELLEERDRGGAASAEADADAADGSETDASGGTADVQPQPSKKAGRGKRKSPAASASASSSVPQKPPVRRTRSNAKKSRAGDGDA